jgi:flagella basal body P-ring formation protein FlgA
MNLRNCVLALQLLCGSAALCHGAVEKAQLGQIVGAIEQLLQQQTVGLPGRVSFSVGAIDRNLNLSVCAAPEAFMAPGARVWGNTSVGVRCVGASPWTIYVPVQVTVSGNYLISARTMPAGYLISAADIVTRSGDLSTLPPNVVTDQDQAIGKTVKIGLSVGQPLRNDQLIAPWAVQQGQTIKTVSNGPGFSVSSEGKALNNAIAGQVVQVRTSSGQTVSGIARPGGTVEISH